MSQWWCWHLGSTGRGEGACLVPPGDTQLLLWLLGLDGRGQKVTQTCRREPHSTGCPRPQWQQSMGCWRPVTATRGQRLRRRPPPLSPPPPLLLLLARVAAGKVCNRQSMTGMASSLWAMAGRVSSLQASWTAAHPLGMCGGPSCGHRQPSSGPAGQRSSSHSGETLRQPARPARGLCGPRCGSSTLPPPPVLLPKPGALGVPVAAWRAEREGAAWTLASRYLSPAPQPLVLVSCSCWRHSARQQRHWPAVGGATTPWPPPLAGAAGR